MHYVRPEPHTITTLDEIYDDHIRLLAAAVVQRAALDVADADLVSQLLDRIWDDEEAVSLGTVRIALDYAGWADVAEQIADLITRTVPHIPGISTVGHANPAIDLTTRAVACPIDGCHARPVGPDPLRRHLREGHHPSHVVSRLADIATFAAESSPF